MDRADELPEVIMLKKGRLYRPFHRMCSTALMLLIVLMLTLPISAENAFSAITLHWTAPTTNTDGSPLTNLAGYRLYYGTSSGSYSHYIPLDDEVTYTFTSLSNGTYYFVVTAINSVGVESYSSNQVSRTETANGSCANPLFKIGSSMYDYQEIQTVYDGLSNGQTLKIRSANLNGDLDIQQNKSVTLQGGYSCDFSSNPGYSYLYGTLTITDGTVIADRLIIQ
jgi:hypothetical protein